MLRDVLSRAAFYLAASVLTMIVGVVALPLYTRFLTPSDFGLLGVLVASVGVLSQVVGFNPHLYFFAQFSHLKRDEARQTITAALAITALSALLVLVALALFAPSLRLERLPRWALVALGVIPALLVVRNLGTTIEKLLDHPISVGSLQVASSVLEHGAALTFVVALGFGWGGRFGGALVSAIGTSCLSVWLLYRRGYLGWQTTWAKVRLYVSYSVPLLPHALGYWAISALDRYFLVTMCGLTETGFYSVAYQICILFPMAASAVLSAFLPRFYARELDSQAKAAIVRFSYGYVGATVFGTSVFILLAPTLIPWFLGDLYRPALVHVPWIAAGYALGSVRDLGAGYLYRADRTRLNALITSGSALLNAGLNWVLISTMGPVGAAIATTITFGVVSLVTAWFAVRAVPMPWLSAFRRGSA